MTKTCLSKEEFKENYYFEAYKDKIFGSVQQLKYRINKLALDPDTKTSLYYKVVNYQIEKYGGLLQTGKEIRKVDLERRRINAKARDLARRKARGIETKRK